MQFAKDSFYIALRDRLAALNPQRTIVVGGVVRPAVLVSENQPPNSAPPPEQAFLLRFGDARPLPATQAAARPLLQLDCEITYATSGSSDNLGVDRDRTLAALDLELLQICSPPSAAKKNYAVTPPVDLGTRLLWNRPQLAKAKSMGSELRRVAAIQVVFAPEVNY